jgi:hypothetical protein
MTSPTNFRHAAALFAMHEAYLFTGTLVPGYGLGFIIPIVEARP